MNQSTSDDKSIQPQPSSLDLTRSRPGPVPVLRYGSPVESDALKHGPRMYVAVVREPAKLIDYVPDWEHLAQHAIEPNLFYEHWFLLPAIEAFGSGVDLRIVFIFSSNPERPTGPPILSGMFPLEHSGSYLGLPAATLSFWKHPQCFLCTPLIRRAQAKETLQAFFAYLASEAAGCSLAELNFIPAEGPLYQVLTGVLHERTVSFFVF